jgi:hypothetical protein
MTASRIIASRDDAPNPNVSGLEQDGMAIVRVSGIATLPTLIRARVEGVRLALEEGLERFVIDCTSAVVAMSEADWDALARANVADPHKLPQALLLSAAVLADAWKCAEQMARHGRIGLAFSKRETAIEWATFEQQPGMRAWRAARELAAAYETNLLLGRLSASTQRSDMESIPRKGVGQTRSRARRGKRA